MSTRETEGFFNKLIEGHYFVNKIKSRENFFRVNRKQFYFIGQKKSYNITNYASTRTIPSDEKLTVTQS